MVPSWVPSLVGTWLTPQAGTWTLLAPGFPFLPQPAKL